MNTAASVMIPRAVGKIGPFLMEQPVELPDEVVEIIEQEMRWVGCYFDELQKCRQRFYIAEAHGPVFAYPVRESAA